MLTQIKIRLDAGKDNFKEMDASTLEYVAKAA